MNNEELWKRHLEEAMRAGRQSSLAAAATLCQLIAMKGGTAQQCAKAIWQLKMEIEKIDLEGDDNIKDLLP